MAKTAAAAWIGRAFLGPPRLSDLGIVAAVVAYWPFQEWGVHKYLLHLEPREKDGETVDPDFARRHREHHRDPRDTDLTLLPFRLVRGAMVTNGLLWLVLLPKRPALTTIAALSTMTLLYEWTHFIVHTGYVPQSRLGKSLRTHHLLHHFHNEHYWMSFTIPWVDDILGTRPDRKDVDRSPTARNLFGLDESSV